jgi:putative flippase GtrA
MIVDKVEEFCLKILEKIGLKALVSWYMEHQEGMRYLVFGALTTLVNIVIYSLLYYMFNISNATSNIIAWILGATFAYVTNKYFVFKSKVSTKIELLKEIAYFYGCRVLTLIIDEAIMIIAVDKWGWNALFMKILANIIVIILNFVFSKILIFKNKKAER